jgi:hypothetical protein
MEIGHVNRESTALLQLILFPPMDVLGKTAWYRGAKNTAIIRWDVVGQGFPLGMKDTFSRLGHKQNSAFYTAKQLWNCA